MVNKVWVELVIDGKNVGQAFQVELTSEMRIHDLKDAVAMKYQFALTLHSIDAASLLVYPPGTTKLSVEDVKPLRPGLPLADLDFRERTDEAPLIVTAVSFLVHTERWQNTQATATNNAFNCFVTQYILLLIYGIRL
jgi:hypothetical protein